MSDLATPPVALTGNVPLPQRYEAARAAIAECDRIDECKDWSDKAAALASYAAQAKDDSLAVYARRIQARAERRCGELLKQIPRADEATRYGQDGTVPPVTRTQAATDAGLSERQRKTALRVATIPTEDFERQVESPTPPTITALAEQGRLSRVSIPDPGGELLKETCAALWDFSNFCDRNDPTDAARTFGADDIEMARRCVSTLDQWLDRFVLSLST